MLSRALHQLFAHQISQKMVAKVLKITFFVGSSNESVLIECPVVVAMSGGVDSSVTAKLLAEKVRHDKISKTPWRPYPRPFQDYDMSAVFMRNWDTRDESGTDVGCEWEKDWDDVQRVCKKLDIPCQMVCESRHFDPVAFDTTKKSLD